MRFSIRKGTPDDAQEIVRVHLAAWRETYHGIVPQAFLDSLDAQVRVEDWRERLHRDNVQVVEDSTGVCGFISGGALREPIEDFDAEIYTIYLLRSAQGQGAGKLLMQHLAGVLRAARFVRMAVWVLADNPSRGFYEHLGATQVAQKQIQIGDADLLEIAYGWRDLQTLAECA